VYCNPEYLIDAVAEKHADWEKYAGTVRMLKCWADEQDIKIKSLVMEVLALNYLPAQGTQATAIKQFFVSASYAIDGGIKVVDPADICGPIQADLDYVELGERLRDARDVAIRAVQAQDNKDAAYAVRLWGTVFGDDFPLPPKGGSNPTPAVAPVLPRPVKDTPQG
jgi:hypothetical protein